MVMLGGSVFGQKVGHALFATACHSLAKVVAYTLKIPKELMDVVVTGEGRVISCCLMSCSLVIGG